MNYTVRIVVKKVGSIIGFGLSVEVIGVFWKGKMRISFLKEYQFD